MFCPNCGTEVSSGDSFCSNCGYKFHTGIVSSQKNNRKHTILIIVAALIMMVLILVIKISSQRKFDYSDPVDTVYAFFDAIEKGDKDRIEEIAYILDIEEIEILIQECKGFDFSEVYVLDGIPDGDDYYEVNIYQKNYLWVPRYIFYLEKFNDHWRIYDSFSISSTFICDY